jgi:hypothetical protein
VGQALEKNDKKFMSANMSAWDKFRADEIDPSGLAGQQRGFDNVGL